MSHMQIVQVSPDSLNCHYLHGQPQTKGIDTAEANIVRHKFITPALFT